VEYSPEVAGDFPATWPDLWRLLEQEAGIASTTMRTLRNLQGSYRTDPTVRDRIEERLSELGVGHIPKQLPTDQNKGVMLYLKGTEAGEIIRAIQGDVPTEALIHGLRNLNRPATEIPLTAAEEAMKQVGEAVGQLQRLLTATDRRPEGQHNSDGHRGGESKSRRAKYV
jgi:hypothetical protein